MDEHDDEQPERGQTSEALCSPADGDLAADTPPESDPPRSEPFLGFWTAPNEQDSRPFDSSFGEEQDSDSPNSRPGAPSYDTFPPSSYGPGGYTQAPYPPYGYGPYGPETYPPGSYYAPTEDQAMERSRPGRARRALAVVAIALVLLSAGAGVGIAYLSRSTQSSTAGLATSPAGRSLTTSEIAAAVDPAVVDIVTNLGEGTGIIATSNGEIITNNHVIEGASSIKVSIENRGSYSAAVVGTDAVADVAVLQLAGLTGLPTVKFANSSHLSIGSSVVAIGNAGGQGFPSTVTAGAVTALGRTIVASDSTGATEKLTGMIQMDALIEPGNSGGPLVDSSGEIVGMDTAAASADGATPIGFALPINRVLQIAGDIAHGKAGKGIVIGVVAFLGIEGQTVSLQGSASSTGVGLEYVDPQSPAATAGIEEGDVIVAFDGHTTASLSELATLIHHLRPGDRATVTYDNLVGGIQTVTVTLGTAPPA